MNRCCIPSFAFMARAGAVSLLLALAACSDTRPGNNYHLGTVAVSVKHRTVFVAAPLSGSIDVLRAGASRAPHQTGYVTRLADAGRTGVLRLAVDDERNRLWVLDSRAVYLYDAAAYRLVRRYDRAGEPEYERFSDLAVDRNGDVYVLARGGARIFRIDAQSGAMAVWLDPFRQVRTAAVYLSNRLVIDERARSLLLVSPVDGQLVEIELDTRRQRALRAAVPIDMTCGLPFWTEGAAPARAITVLDCAGMWVATATVDEERVNASVTGLMSLRGDARVTSLECSRPSLASC